jgi:glycosyltransferase involved in cell wall biosynthesis
MATGARYVIDAHSGAFLDERWTRLLFVQRFFCRRAAVTFVTSPFWADLLTSWGANSKIVSDVPIYFAEPRSKSLKGRINMTFISTYTRDEPLKEFLAAVRHTPDIQFYITGRLKDADPEVLKLAPRNVAFTDFLSNEEYTGLLMASDAVICLTTGDHTMQRGAYEAVYLGRPVITSNTQLLKESFSAGAVHVGNTPEEMVHGIEEMKRNLKKYQMEVMQLRMEKLDRWQKVQEDLNRLFNGGGAQNDQ